MSRQALTTLREDTRVDVDWFNISTADSLVALGKPTFGKLLRFVKLLLRVVTTAARKDFDVLYITLTPTGGAFYKDALLLLGVKPLIPRCLIHLHGKGICAEIGLSRVRRAIYQTVFSGCEVVHLSPALLSDLAPLAIGKTHIVPNGIDDKARHFSGAAKRFDFLFLSNLIEAKGIFEFLDAVTTLVARGYPCKVALVGAFSNHTVEQRVMALLAQPELHDAVEYFGPRYEDAKFEVLAQARCFVLPSRNECFPISILEAMSFGVPVISTSVGAIPEIITDGVHGRIVPPRSVEPLVAAMQQMLDDPQAAAAMGRAAREKFEYNYTLDRFNSKFVSTVVDGVVAL